MPHTIEHASLRADLVLCSKPCMHAASSTRRYFMWPTGLPIFYANTPIIYMARCSVAKQIAEIDFPPIAYSVVSLYTKLQFALYPCPGVQHLSCRMALSTWRIDGRKSATTASCDWTACIRGVKCVLEWVSGYSRRQGYVYASSMFILCTWHYSGHCSGVYHLGHYKNYWTIELLTTIEHAVLQYSGFAKRPSLHTVPTIYCMPHSKWL